MFYHDTGYFITQNQQPKLCLSEERVKTVPLNSFLSIKFINLNPKTLKCFFNKFGILFLEQR